jgi:hypothetical protein
MTTRTLGSYRTWSMAARNSLISWRPSALRASGRSSVNSATPVSSPLRYSTLTCSPAAAAALSMRTERGAATARRTAAPRATTLSILVVSTSTGPAASARLAKCCCRGGGIRCGGCRSASDLKKRRALSTDVDVKFAPLEQVRMSLECRAFSRQFRFYWSSERGFIARWLDTIGWLATAGRAAMRSAVGGSFAFTSNV